MSQLCGRDQYRFSLPGVECKIQVFRPGAEVRQAFVEGAHLSWNLWDCTTGIYGSIISVLITLYCWWKAML